MLRQQNNLITSQDLMENNYPKKNFKSEQNALCTWRLFSFRCLSLIEENFGIKICELWVSLINECPSLFYQTFKGKFNNFWDRLIGALICRVKKKLCVINTMCFPLYLIGTDRNKEISETEVLKSIHHSHLLINIRDY